MSCKFFNAKEWKEVVEKLPEDPGIVHCDEVRISHFENINLDRSMILCLPKTSENNPFDGFKWTRSENGRRIQPIYRKYRINESSYQGLHCTESKIAFLRKDILHYETKTYLHYFLSDVELFELPSANELTKPRVSGSVSTDLKENILPQRTTSAAYEIAKQKGYQVSRKQINNLRRGRTDVIVGKSGRRAVTTLHHIEILEKNFPQNLTYFIDHNNELVYGFVKVFEDGIRIFTASCPNEIEFEKWTCFVKEVEEDDRETRRQKIKEKLKHHPSGLIFPSRVYVDTTFNLTDAYVTLILGETNSFQTKTSGKPRIIPLGYLLHSHKNETHHQFFADCLKEVVEPYLIDKKVPCVMMDGEPALNVYAEALSSNVVRCDWHILRGLSLKHRQKAAKQACRVLFGYKDTNHKWKCGLFGSFTEEQFERRLLKVKNLVDSRIFTWLEKNKRWLMTTSTAIAKLRSGLILQYATTNPSENFNQQLKGVFRKPFSAEILIKKLDDFCNEKLFELIKSAIGESEYVVTKEDYARLSFDERETEFRKIGLQCARLLAYDPPRNLLKCIDIKKCDEEENQSKFITLNSITGCTYVLENRQTSLTSPDRISLVTQTRGLLECSVCKQTLPRFVCRHVLSCLREMGDLDVKVELWRMDDFCRDKRIVAVPTRAGKKPSDRMGSRASAQNHIREIRDFSDMTELDEISSQVVSVNNEDPEDNDSEVSDTSPVSTPLETTLFSSDVVVDEQLNTMSTESTFSPQFMSTRIDDSSSSYSSRRNRKQRVRYSPTPSTSDFY